jgi:hypothetical protein
MTTPVKFAGSPDGPQRYVDELGCAVGTFTAEPKGPYDSLRHHVPLKMRGDFRPEDLANFNPEKIYRTDALGKVLCYAKTKADVLCKKRAVNRYPRCDSHGGRLHPLDRIVHDEETAANESEGQSLSRYRQFQAGQITVDDLDDEELATCGFRSEKNGVIYRPKNVPRELAQAFTRAMYERAQAELRSLTMDAVHTVGEIFKNKNNEPDIRLKGALAVIERNLGKTPQVVALTGDKGFEEVFSDILSGSREESRRSRVESERIQDVEIVDDIIGERPNHVDTVEESDRRHESADQPTVPISTALEVVSDEKSRGSDPESQRDPRLYERNPAILAQTLEIKPFEYDLSNKAVDIAAATRKRYASRALGIDLSGPRVPYIIEETKLVNCCVIRAIDPDTIKIAQPSKQAVNKRKTFTLNDFQS